MLMDLSELQGLTNTDLVVNALRRRNTGNWKDGGTDKEQLASGVKGPSHHSYGAVYSEIISYLQRENRCSAVLEIGIQRGASLLLWQDLFPNAKVVGVDVEDQITQSTRTQLDLDRVHLVWGNAYRRKIIDRVAALAVGGYSLIIDDGPHSARSQHKFLKHYLLLLAHGGIAAIEDIQRPDDMKALAASVPHGFVAQCVDRRYVNGRSDDLMVVVQRLP